MSVQAMAWVFDHSESEGSDRLVLLAIANHCNAKEPAAWPSIATIAAEARVDRATVYRSLKRLVALGELNVVSGGNRGVTNLYTLPLVPVATRDSLPVATRVAAGDGSRRNRATQNQKGTVEPCDTVKRPPPLPDDERRRGAAFVRYLRTGESNDAQT